MAKFFRLPFAINGNRAAIPDPPDGGGLVSYDEGYTFDYQRDPETDPLAKNIERDKQNDLFYQITLAIQQYQTQGFPDFITTADNGGVAYSYDKYAYVRWNNGVETAVYESLVSANTSLPSDTTKWRQVVPPQPFPTGTILEYDGATLPSDAWIWPDGKTIGNAASGATNRANADTLALFTQTWTSYPNSVRPIENSDGTAGSRGISAQADFDAGKRLPVRDKRGIVGAGKDDMGGTAANRLTGTSGGVNGAILGATGGAQTHQLSGQEAGGVSTVQAVIMSANTFSEITIPNDGSQSTPSGANEPNDSGSPRGYRFRKSIPTAHNNVQPTTIVNFILKL